MSHAARWVSDADRDAWQFHRAQRQQVSSPVSQGRGKCDEGSFQQFCVSTRSETFLCNTEWNSSFSWLTLPLLFFYISELDLGPKRVGAGCGGQQEDALPQLWQHAGLPGDTVIQGPTGCHRPGPGPPVSPAVRVGQTLEQPGDGLAHTPLPGSDQLTLQ